MNERGSLTASFLTCGVDSMFTALDHGTADGRVVRGMIDEFLFVHGFDVPISDSVVASRVLRTVQDAASALDRTMVPIRTNLRETRWGTHVDWERWGHGAALASVALALIPRYRLVLIPASNLYSSLVPWGSHPLTDPLFSSWTLRIRDDGAAYDRTDKAFAIAASDVALRHLRVCWQSAGRGGNCGRCHKCMLTMLTFETAVGLCRCPTFPSRIEQSLLRKLTVTTPWDRRHMERLQERAAAIGRDDVVRTIDRLLAKPNAALRVRDAAARLYRGARSRSQRFAAS
jgi:hypothetical protein